MREHTCKQCLITFKHSATIKVFCSKDCYIEWQRLSGNKINAKKLNPSPIKLLKPKAQIIKEIKMYIEEFDNNLLQSLNALNRQNIDKVFAFIESKKPHKVSKTRMNAFIARNCKNIDIKSISY